MADTHDATSTPIQKIVVVDGNAEELGMLETVLDAGCYDMVFVESSHHAYSQIRKVLPNLVIVCADFEHPYACQLLTMLKLDPDTRDVPVLTYTTEARGRNLEAAISQLDQDDEDVLSARPALRMN